MGDGMMAGPVATLLALRALVVSVREASATTPLVIMARALSFVVVMSLVAVSFMIMTPRRDPSARGNSRPLRSSVARARTAPYGRTMRPSVEAIAAVARSATVLRVADAP